MADKALSIPLTPLYGAGVQLEFFVVFFTTKKADGTEVAHDNFVSHFSIYRKMFLLF